MAVAVHPERGQCGQAPERRAGNDERLAPEAIAEPARQRRGHHVENEERGAQRAHLLVGRVELVLDGPHLAGKNIAVDVVEQIQRNEQQNRAQRGVQAGAQVVCRGRQAGRSWTKSLSGRSLFQI